MSAEIYKYEFNDDVPPRELEESLLLAVLAVECLHGESRVRLHARYCLRANDSKCVIDATTDVGRDLAKIFTGFASREFGQDSFRVRQVPNSEDVVQEASR